MRLKTVKSGQGFTIVELMIALTVLSTILVMATVIMINIGSLYTKGVNLANLQNTNRNIITDLSSALQFSGKSPLFYPNTYPTPDADGFLAVCLGNTRYSYRLYRELGDDSRNGATFTTNHVLWRDTMAPGVATCRALDLSQNNPTTDPARAGESVDGYEMIGAHMRLTKVEVNDPSGSGSYNVSVSLAYGDSDLLCDTSEPGNCDSDTEILPANPNPDRVLCKGRIAQQFCGTSKLSTTVTRRAK